MNIEIRQEGKFRFIESGEGEVIILLHGLFGALSNFKTVLEHFSKNYKVSIPLLPIYELPLENTTVPGLVDHVNEFIEFKGYQSVTLLGNSLGGHIALLYALLHQEKIKAIVLTGSSGLFESSLGDTYPKKGDYEFVKKKTEYTFHNPEMASKELVDEVYDIVNNREKAIRVISMAKSAMRHNLRDSLQKIKVPVLLIWGKNDTITPQFVGEEFEKLLPNAELKLIDECGHAPMMEKPHDFNAHVEAFFQKIYISTEKD